MSADKHFKLLFNPALLLTESREEFDALRVAIDDQIEPRNVIEVLYSADVARLQWEVLRAHRCKAHIVNLAFRRALKSVLRHHFHASREADELVDRWFTKPEAKKEVRDILAQCSLDEFAVEAEALRLSLSDVEKFDRILAALESRRNKAIRCIDEYRASFKQSRGRSNRLFESSEIRSLEDKSSKRTA